jgi:hypothetical protein
MLFLVNEKVMVAELLVLAKGKKYKLLRALLTVVLLPVTE